MMELLQSIELNSFGVSAIVTIALLNLIIELVRELVIDYHKKR